MAMPNKYHQILALVGPTASGKTRLALSIAQHFPVEIVNADSLQLFRHLNIGTAKPTVDERIALVHNTLHHLPSHLPYHLIDVLDPSEEMNAAWYSRQAHKIMDNIFSRKRIPLLVGGAGFYLRALEHPPLDEEGYKNEKIQEGSYELIQKEDPEAAKWIHENDRYRIARATALLKKGIRPSELWKQTLATQAHFKIQWIGLYVERQKLCKQIDSRVDWMFDHGLLEETEEVRQQFPQSALRLKKTIGYRQCLEILDHKADRSQKIMEVKTQTRQYAKRQMTWFRKDRRIEWLDPENVLPHVGHWIDQMLSS